MNYILIDTETTGFRGTVGHVNGNSYTLQGEVIQLSALVIDTNLNVKDVISFYCMPTEPISDEAYKVHHISNDSILRLSGGKSLEEYLYIDYKDIFFSKGNIFMGYNFSFDISAINNTLKDYNIPTVDFGFPSGTVYGLDNRNNYNFDIMKAASSYMKSNKLYSLPKFPRLEESIKYLGYSTYIDDIYKYVMSKFNRTTSSDYHNADYDVVATWVVLCKVIC